MSHRSKMNLRSRTTPVVTPKESRRPVTRSHEDEKRASGRSRKPIINDDPDLTVKTTAKLNVIKQPTELKRSESEVNLAKKKEQISKNSRNRKIVDASESEGPGTKGVQTRQRTQKKLEIKLIDKVQFTKSTRDLIRMARRNQSREKTKSPNRKVSSDRKTTKNSTKSLPQRAKCRTPRSQTAKSTPRSQTPKSQTPKTQTPKMQTPRCQTPTPRGHSARGSDQRCQTPKIQTPKLQTPRPETPKAKNIPLDIESKESKIPASKYRSPRKISAEKPDIPVQETNKGTMIPNTLTAEECKKLKTDTLQEKPCYVKLTIVQNLTQKVNQENVQKTVESDKSVINGSSALVVPSTLQRLRSRILKEKQKLDDDEPMTITSKRSALKNYKKSQSSQSSFGANQSSAPTTDIEKIYEYTSNSQESLSTDQADDAMKELLKKLQREKKITIKRKAPKRLQSTKNLTNNIPFWHERQKNFKMKEGLKALKNVLNISRNHKEFPLSNVGPKTQKNEENFRLADHNHNSAAATTSAAATPKKANTPTDSVKKIIDESTDYDITDLDINKIDIIDNTKTDKETAIDHQPVEPTERLSTSKINFLLEDLPNSVYEIDVKGSNHDELTIDLSKTVNKTYPSSPRKLISSNNDIPTHQSTPLRNEVCVGDSPWRVPIDPPKMLYRNYLPTYSSEFVSLTEKSVKQLPPESTSPKISTFAAGPAASVPTTTVARHAVHQKNQATETSEQAFDVPKYTNIHVNQSKSSFCRAQSVDASTITNISDIENIAPSNHEQMLNLIKNRNTPVKIIRPNVKNKKTRTPLKSLAIKNTLKSSQITVPEKKKEPSSICIIDSSSVHHTLTDTVSNGVQNYFGFISDTDDDDIEPALPKQIDKSKDIKSLQSARTFVPLSSSSFRSPRNDLKEKMKKLKTIQPIKRLPTRAQSPKKKIMDKTMDTLKRPKVGVKSTDMFDVPSTSQKTLEEMFKQKKQSNDNEQLQTNISGESKISIFDDPEEQHDSPILFKSWIEGGNDSTVKTYGRTHKRNRGPSFSYSDNEEDNEEEIKNNKPKKRKKDDQVQVQKFNEFIDHFNSMCEDIEKYDLIVEKSS